MKGRAIEDAALVMDGADTVATAINELEAGRRFDVDGRTVELAEDIPFGHKFALEEHDAGDDVYKYGQAIGRATAPIAPGEHVHTHNVASRRGRTDGAEEPGTA